MKHVARAVLPIIWMDEVSTSGFSVLLCFTKTLLGGIALKEFFFRTETRVYSCPIDSLLSVTYDA